MAVAAVLLGSLGGGLLGYALARSRARREYAARLDEAVAELKVHYTRPIFSKTNPEFDKLIDAVELDNRRPRWASLIRDTIETKSVPDPLEGIGVEPDGTLTGDEDSYSGQPGTETEGTGELQDLGPVPEGVPLEEPPFPFEISEAQFGELSEEGFQTISVTYYAADKVLVDDKDQPIRDVQGTVGTVNPLGFGGISGDPHIRYVRNRRLVVDFEILLDARSYTSTVLGYGQPDRRREANSASTAK